MFKAIIRLFTFSLLLLCANTFAGKENELVKIAHLKNYLKIFDDKKSEHIWPGFHPNKKPIYLYFKSGNYYALNFSPFSIDWKAVETPAGYIYTTSYDKWGISKRSTTKQLTIDGQNGFAYQFDQLTEDLSLHVFVHERFHRYQQHKFQNIDNNDWYLDSNNLENLALISLENKIINHYLHSNDTEDLKDFLIVNSYRKRLIKRSSWNREMHMQRIEGTATYVELLAKSYFEKGNNELLPEFILKEQHRRRRADGFNLIVDQAARWRHYFVGATICLALDRLHVKNWKEQVEMSLKNPIEILKHNLPLEIKDRGARLAQIKKKYHFAKSSQQARKAFDDYQSRYQQWHKLLKNNNGFYLEVSKPNYELLSTKRSQRQYYLADQSVLEINTEGKVENKTKDWKMKFKRLPIMINNRVAWIFKLSEKTEFIIDGKPLQLSELKKCQTLKFRSLDVTSKQMKFTTRVPGVIFNSNNHIKIKSGSWHS